MTFHVPAAYSYPADMFPSPLNHFPMTKKTSRCQLIVPSQPEKPGPFGGFLPSKGIYSLDHGAKTDILNKELIIFTAPVELINLEAKP
jgi:hypothetical protein